MTDSMPSASSTVYVPSLTEILSSALIVTVRLAVTAEKSSVSLPVVPASSIVSVPHAAENLYASDMQALVPSIHPLLT